MTLEELWLKFVSYPDRLELFNRNTNVLDGIEDESEMEEFVCENGDLTVVDFEVDFNLSILHIELE